MLALAEAQERAVRHDEGALLLVGEAGSGKTEALARRLARLAAEGTPPQRVLLLAAAPATARRLRGHATEAGLDPFFDVLWPAERLAMLLDRLDALPLRHHDVRGHPAGLPARLRQQIDALKAGSGPADPELAELVSAHDRILASACSLDRGDVFLTLNRLLQDRPEARHAIASRFEHVMVDELEDTTPAQRAILAALAEDNPNHLYTAADGPKTGRKSAGIGPSAGGLREWALSVHPGAEVVELERQFRDPPVRLWRCSNERAQAQAVAREAEHLIAQGVAP